MSRQPETEISLLDYFAARALQGELASSGSSESATAIAKAAFSNGFTPERQLATNAYDTAEAMIAERARRKASK